MSKLGKILAPPAQASEFDTGLRFTDILFGFVIRELFLRLQHWSELPGYVRWQLITAAVLVIGSWIGFRRSLNRSSYELKFFNLPLLRFGLDQTMVLLYFRIATLSPNLDDKTAKVPDAATLARHTAWILLLIFVLYILWDFFGIWMGFAPKYTNGSSPDGWGFLISGLCLAVGFALWRVADSQDLSRAGAEKLLAVATALLLAYRFGKEIRTSFQKPPPPHASLGTIWTSLKAARGDIKALTEKVDKLE
jgi:hypothetical protein